MNESNCVRKSYMIFFIPLDGRWQKTVPLVEKCGVQSSRGREGDAGRHRPSGSEEARGSQEDGVSGKGQDVSGFKWLGDEVIGLQFKG